MTPNIIMQKCQNKKKSTLFQNISLKVILPLDWPVAKKSFHTLRNNTASDRCGSACGCSSSSSTQMSYHTYHMRMDAHRYDLSRRCIFYIK